VDLPPAAGRSVQGRHPFKLSISTAGGHAAMPPIDGSHSARVTADILHSIDAHQPPFALRPPVTDMLKAVAPHAPLLLRGVCAYADVWCAAGPLFFICWAYVPDVPPNKQTHLWCRHLVRVCLSIRGRRPGSSATPVFDNPLANNIACVHPSAQQRQGT
jgi:hypothetical protein